MIDRTLGVSLHISHSVDDLMQCMFQACVATIATEWMTPCSATVSYLRVRRLNITLQTFVFMYVLLVCFVVFLFCLCLLVVRLVVLTVVLLCFTSVVVVEKSNSRS